MTTYPALVAFETSLREVYRKLGGPVTISLGETALETLLQEVSSALADAGRFSQIAEGRCCPYAETGAEWDSPENLRAAVDQDAALRG